MRVILISDATASGVKKHYKTTLEHVRDYYAIVTNPNGFEKIVKLMKQIEGERPIITTCQTQG
jgi:ureidoacrylate peracid hydrolase